MSHLHVLALAALLCLPAQAAPKKPEVPPFLSPTALIDLGNAELRSRAKQLSEGLSDPRARALAIFHFVRDEIRFGWNEDGPQATASEVLKSGMGNALSKTTLFVALLRAAGVPARPFFVDLNVEVLRGLGMPGPYIDHAWTEVQLDGKWLRTDAYTVDKVLFQRAQARLQAEGARAGYGVHLESKIDWDGHSNAFVQFVPAGIEKASLNSWGVFADASDFYKRAHGPRNRPNWAIQLFYSSLVATPNKRVIALRNGG
jgi:transglutaminase-like putative cysteine protease